ncbi:hypothetical protein [Flavobacterium columnare]|uniref:Uncharacterized protein n=1 Tax=Flavobacterium columnare TaxID=996 RepID=A0AA94F2L4_9FLAO|nr:hypothetical protein [Flavobacterium columnare]MCH4829570.1 hypothetical protein [Flavobacterium columnare]MCH4831433.1 hypothetical protein [Flavobacterium columnare]
MSERKNTRLEVFTISLKKIEGNPKNSFEDLIANIKGVDISKNLFNEFYQFFVNHIDLGYTTIRNKAFTLSTDKADTGISIDNHSFWGVLKGGPTGSGKTKSPIINREEEEDLDGDVINNKFFFYFHFPLKSDYGYLFFQVYGGESIRQEFIQHIMDLFKVSGKYNKAICTSILPNSIRNEFKNNSKVVELNYITKALSSSITDNTEFTNLCKNYKIEISIKPEGNTAIESEKVNFLNRILSSLKFNERELSDASKTKVSLQNLSTKRTSTFELDTNEVMPRIYLDGKVDLDVYGTPIFPKLKLFCDGLLKEIIRGEYQKMGRIK